METGSNLLPNEAIRWSKSALRAVKKRGAEIQVIRVIGDESDDVYSQLYGQPELIKSEDNFTIHGIFQSNIPEDLYKALKLNLDGDAIIEFIAYELLDNGIIDNTLESFREISSVLIGNRIEVGGKLYRVDECKYETEYKGFPLQILLNLKYLDEDEWLAN